MAFVFRKKLTLTGHCAMEFTAQKGGTDTTRKPRTAASITQDKNMGD